MFEELEDVFLQTDPSDYSYSPIEEVEDWFWQRLKQALPEIKKLKAAGYKPIAYSVMVCEDTFVFATDEEAKKAHHQFEATGKGIDKIQGWWYGKDDFFNTALPDYRKKMSEIDKDYIPQYVLLK